MSTEESPVKSKSENPKDFAYYANQADQLFLSHLTLGIEEKLKKNKMIKEVKLTIRKPCDKSSLSAWERRYGLTFPRDFKDYYLSTNGFRLTWSLEHSGEILRIGDMNLNTLSCITPIESSPNDLNNSSTSQGSSGSNKAKGSDYTKATATNKNKPDSSKNDTLQISFGEFQQMINKAIRPTITPRQSSVNSESWKTPSSPGTGQSMNSSSSRLSLKPEGKAFRLDSNRSQWGTTFLVYPSGRNSSNESQLSPPMKAHYSQEVAKGQKHEPNVQIWFLDPSYQWHFLAPTFGHFYRMLLIHLGLPQWQYRFTPFGLSSWAEQIFWLVAPHLLQTPKITNFPNLYTGLWSPDVPSEAANPNPINNTISINLFRKRKKVEKSQK